MITILEKRSDYCELKISRIIRQTLMDIFERKLPNPELCNISRFTKGSEIGRYSHIHRNWKKRHNPSCHPHESRLVKTNNQTNSVPRLKVVLHSANGTVSPSTSSHTD